MNSEELRVINLYGAPGVGKSSARSGIFWLMKSMSLSVEEVSEYAKYLVLSGQSWQLKEDQLYVVANQHHKQLILRGKYEFAVTDSPILLASFYAPENTPLDFHGMCREYSSRFSNLNIFLKRDLDAQPFENQGRIHTKEDSLRIESEQKEFLSKMGESWVDMEIGPDTPWAAVSLVAERWPDSFKKASWPERPNGLVSFNQAESNKILKL